MYKLISATTYRSLVDIVNKNCEQQSLSSPDIERVLLSYRYTLEPFDMRVKEAAIELLSIGFAEENAIFVHVEAIREQLEERCRRFPFEALDTSCSFLVYATGARGAERGMPPLTLAFSMDHDVHINYEIKYDSQNLSASEDERAARDLCAGASRSSVPALRRASLPHFRVLCRSGRIEHSRWLYQFSLVVAADEVLRADCESALLVDLIERRMLRRARAAGYFAVTHSTASTIVL